MARVKSGTTTRQRKKKTFKIAKGSYYSKRAKWPQVCRPPLHRPKGWLIKWMALRSPRSCPAFPGQRLWGFREQSSPSTTGVGNMWPAGDKANGPSGGRTPPQSICLCWFWFFNLIIWLIFRKFTICQIHPKDSCFKLYCLICLF